MYSVAAPSLRTATLPLWQTVPCPTLPALAVVFEQAIPVNISVHLFVAVPVLSSNCCVLSQGEGLLRANLHAVESLGALPALF